MSIASSGPPAPVTLLLFRINGQRYALPSSAVKEVLPAVTFETLPGAPAIVEGVANVRGSLVAVLDIRARLRHAAKPLELTDHLIVAHAGARVVALRADHAEALVAIHPADIEDATRSLPAVDYICGVAKLADGLVLIHDLQSLLSDVESTALSNWLKDQAPAGSV